MSKESVLSAIKNVAESVIPKSASVILFGSQARGDEHADSDWDVLIIVDKDKLFPEDHDSYSYPFWELGWKIDAMIHPVVYTRRDWQTKSNPVFRNNVEREGIVLC
ncbi:MAG: nucleotidyltransferase domain-containing protein [Prevotella sp.]|nr:nucleotidyltransferase domain-containing protein [Prevotella sp.]